MAASTYDAKHSIIDVLKKLGGATTDQAAQALGGDWPDNKPKLQKMLGRMVKPKLLRKDGHAYHVSEYFAGVDQRERSRTRIALFLSKCGGIARTRDIKEALSVGDPGYDHKRITLALKEFFSQDFGRGFWNLPTDEIKRLPLAGKWADYMIQLAWTDEKTGFETWQEKRAHFFGTVGNAFNDARGELDIAEIITHPEIAEALHTMGNVARTARVEAVESLRADVEQEARSSGIKEEWIIARMVRERKVIDLPLYLYVAFEAGDVGLHLAAPIELYRACALLFGVSPAKLSRGLVEPIQAAMAAE